MKITLLITVYNRLSHLNNCLSSIFCQTIQPDEVIVVDDGSDPKAEGVVNCFAKRFPKITKYFWIEDDGFRANHCRNIALRNAVGDYIVQIDSDIILEPHLIQDHLHFSRPNRFCLSLVKQLTEEETKERSLEQILSYKPFRSYLKCNLNHYLFKKKNYARGNGNNMSYWLKDAKSINGWDEEWSKPGKDDKDFGARLIHYGCECFNIRYCAYGFHQYHSINPNFTGNEKERKIYSDTLATKKIKCTKGIFNLQP